ncbi:MAG: hypothetical protein J6H20_02350, partial [Pyramidobacter sp.]|nr:hypothetical protein [Pyramidobacter sp.]
MMVDYLISSGFGPAECELAVARFADYAAASFGCGAVSHVPGTRSGTYRSVVVRAWSDADNGPLDGFLGSVMWICRSPFRPEHRRKNWFIRVTRAVPSNAGAYTGRRLY